jgi:tetratricopeptide (TPR) repeat protein
MTKDTIICARCGAKVPSTRTKCPRCRAVVTDASKSQVQLSKRTAAIAGTVLALAAVATLAILWRGDREPTSTAPAKPNPSGPGRPADAPSVVAQTKEAPPDPPFELSSRLLPGPRSGGDDAESLASFRAAIERDPQNAAALYGAGSALLRLRRTREALVPLQQAVALQGDNGSYVFTYGYAAALSEQWSDAAAAFRQACTLLPEDPAPAHDLALALKKLGDYPGAAQQYEAAIRLDSRAVGPRLGLAITLDRLGRRADAIKAYEECLLLMPAGAEADRVRARIGRLKE